jgi:imidazolonepropionase-like amidohydrolase
MYHLTRLSKSCLLLSVFLFTFCAGSAQEIVDSEKREIVFRSVNVITMENDKVQPDQDVVIRNGRIVSVGKAGQARPGNNALLIDGKGKYLMPGLAEMHAHVPPVDDLEPMKEVLTLFACNGITTIRGMLGHPRHLELRSKIEKGEILGPRFYTSGPSFSGGTVASPQAATEMVSAQKKAGYDFLKLHPGLNVEKFNSLVQTAKTENIPFAGHVSFDVGIWRAIEAGYATIDHMDGFIEGLVPGIDSMTEQQSGFFGLYAAKLADTTRIRKLMDGLRHANVWVVPTQALAERWMAPASSESFRSASEMKYMNDQTLNNWTNSKNSLMNNPRYKAAEVNDYLKLRRRLIHACQQYGVGLLLGSDAPQVFNVPGFSVHHELEYMVNSGLTPYQALQSGTVNVARFYNQTQDRGMVKKGMVADLVLLDGNPLTDIKQTRNVAGVMLRNRWLSKAFIDQELKKLEKRQ